MEARIENAKKKLMSHGLKNVETILLVGDAPEEIVKFAKKESTYDRNKNTLIYNDTLQFFETELKKLILEICNPEMDFVEKEIE